MFMAGAYNKHVASAFANATGCRDYIQLANANHFGITDYNPDSEHQVLPIALQLICFSEALCSWSARYLLAGGKVLI